MDFMILGETVAAQAASSPDMIGYWMPARGNDGVAAIEVFYVSNTSVFTVHLDTKSSDDADSAASSIGNTTVSSTTPQIFKWDVSNAKDLVRYRIVPAGEDSEYMHFQFAEPLWAPN